MLPIINLDDIFNQQFFEEESRWKNDYQSIAQFFLQTTEIETIIDLGCGNGYLLDAFMNAKKKVKGVDISRTARILMPRQIQPFVAHKDLTQSLAADENRYDLTVCIQVGEYIPDDYADVFVDNICNNAKDMILFSSALLTFYGLYRINCQPLFYWIQKFEKRGFVFNYKWTQSFRQWINQTTNIVHQWLCRTSIIFIRNNVSFNDDAFFAIPGHKNSDSKVFGIGFHKTGTTSLDLAARALGYRLCPAAHDLFGDYVGKSFPYSIINTYDFFIDIPWFLLYKQMDEHYCNAKFILTVRNTNDWIQSMVNHFGFKNEKSRLSNMAGIYPAWVAEILHNMIYGQSTPEDNEEIYIKRYEVHNQEVLRYFQDRPDDLLVMDICNGDGWKKLCPFLGKEVPSCDFPWTNRKRFKSGLQPLND